MLYIITLFPPPLLSDPLFLIRTWCFVLSSCYGLSWLIYITCQTTGRVMHTDMRPVTSFPSSSSTKQWVCKNEIIKMLYNISFFFLTTQFCCLACCLLSDNFYLPGFFQVFILEELLSPVVTPIILIFSLRRKSLEIIDFFRNFTVEVVGVGDTCSFAQMDIRQHGHPAVSSYGMKHRHTRHPWLYYLLTVSHVDEFVQKVKYE